MEEEILAKLSAQGLRLTAQRRQVLAIILAEPCLKSAEDIYRSCQTQGEEISLPTVYRTLARFERAGVVRKLLLGDGRSWYEVLGRGEHHHHLICQQCGAKVAIAACPQQIIAREASRNHFQVLDHHFEIVGLCRDCQNKEGELGI